MNLLLSRLLDDVKATQRVRTILINIGVYLSAIVLFFMGYLGEIGEIWLKAFTVILFISNALAGIINEPNRMIPINYKLEISDNRYYITLKTDYKFLNILRKKLEGTDRYFTILLNILYLAVFAFLFLIESDIISEEVLYNTIIFGTSLNTTLGLFSEPARTVPEDYNLYLDDKGVYSILPKNYESTLETYDHYNLTKINL